ncbi:hypothetical protein SAMN04488037_101468 [Shimia marina]|uniref:Uncharacterized protein n=1 Tax=Shimia marina TaxID=321267 RepID=A0A0N7LRM1_9RHOB|nr:hypothetical protein SHM7688_00638 [Shimia marina]SFD55184.1 hypothetical protein SAMN04488037_101468 [Shimia marina]
MTSNFQEALWMVSATDCADRRQLSPPNEGDINGSQLGRLISYRNSITRIERMRLIRSREET